MTESLVVDPARLKANGIAVRDQVLPAAPPPISATGTDSVAAAINATLPIIESPVAAGLPDVQAALTNTGSKIVTAAEMYAQTDQLLSEHLAKVSFLATAEPAGTGPPTGAARPKLLGAETTDKNDDKKPDKKPQPAVPSDLNQLSGLAQAAQPLTQGMQGIMQSVQQAGGGMGNAGAAPAKLADDTKRDDPEKAADAPAGESRLVDATTNDADGATPGMQGSGSAPVQAPTGGRPRTTQPETAL
jgi:hypothetical protein